MKKLKVWHRGAYAVVATSRKRAAELFECSDGYVRNYLSTTVTPAMETLIARGEGLYKAPYDAHTASVTGQYVKVGGR